MSIQVRIDTGLCEGHAQCVRAAPQVFDIADSDEQARVLVPNPPDDVRADVESARNLCPTNAVLIDE